MKGEVLRVTSGAKSAGVQSAYRKARTVVPFPPELDREKIRPGSTVEVILMLEDDSQRELEALLANFRRGTGDFSEREVEEIVDEAVAAVRKAGAGD